MSYCVHCGVELDPLARRCPLCGTPVHDPCAEPPEEQAPFFTPREVEVAPVSRLEVGLLITVMLVSVGACCMIANLFIGRGTAWSLYVAGAAATIWLWFILPLMVRKMPLWTRLLLDVAAVGLYLYLICTAVHGGWFLPLAMPLLIVAGMIALVLGVLLGNHRRSVISTITLDILAFGLFMLATEYYGDLYFHGEWAPAWSMVLFLICVALVIPLVIVRRVPSLREEAQRRFHR